MSDPDPEISPGLAAYLRRAAGQPFAWGALDCSLFMAGWVLARAGIDPAAALRGRYSTERGALRLARRLGGMEAVARRQMAAAGFATTREPVPGDVGIIAHPRIGPTCAILTDYGWAMKSPQGVSVARFPTIISWRLT